MRGILNTYTVEYVKNVILTSQTMLEAAKRLGYSSSTGFYGVIKRYAKKNNLENEIKDLRKKSEIFRLQASKNTKFELRKTDEEIFCINSCASRNTVKRRILEKGLLEYKCAICGNKGLHNNKPLSLQLDHINGVNNDHRLENLRWLCPNCHSQTETFSGKKTELKRKIKELEKEKKEKIIDERKKYFDSIDTTKYGWMSQAEKDLGISHTQIKRWINKYYPELKFFQRK